MGDAKKGDKKGWREKGWGVIVYRENVEREKGRGGMGTGKREGGMGIREKRKWVAAVGMGSIKGEGEMGSEMGGRILGWK